jgi:hypothetical protein
VGQRVLEAANLITSCFLVTPSVTLGEFLDSEQFRSARDIVDFTTVNQWLLTAAPYSYAALSLKCSIQSLVSADFAEDECVGDLVLFWAFEQ